MRILKLQLKIGLFVYELKQHKPWSDEECLDFISKEAG